MRNLRALSITPDGRPKMSEEAWQARVIQLARWYKWKTAHFRPALVKCKRCRGKVGLNPDCKICKGQGFTYRTAVQGDGKGFLDTVLVKPPRLIFCELKVDGEKIRDADQRDWFDLLSRCPGAETYVWTPGDYDEVERVLGR